MGESVEMTELNELGDVGEVGDRSWATLDLVCGGIRGATKIGALMTEMGSAETRYWGGCGHGGAGGVGGGTWTCGYAGCCG
jgi:hypothetical protein